MTRDEVLGLLADGGSTQIKLCGLSTQADVAAACAARPDMVGFVVDVPSSRRNVAPLALGPLAACVDDGIVRVGVFVDEPPEVLERLWRHGVLDAVQLHGHEDEAYITRLHARCDVPIVQAFRARSPHDVERARNSSADLVLLDNGQGTGVSFDWSLVRDVGRPFVLAGGLDPRNVAGAIADVAPWGVDMSSGIETNGRKDPEKMRAAVAAVRSAG